MPLGSFFTARKYGPPLMVYKPKPGSPFYRAPTAVSKKSWEDPKPVVDWSGGLPQPGPASRPVRPVSPLPASAARPVSPSPGAALRTSNRPNTPPPPARPAPATKLASRPKASTASLLSPPPPRGALRVSSGAKVTVAMLLETLGEIALEAGQDAAQDAAKDLILEGVHSLLSKLWTSPSAHPEAPHAESEEDHETLIQSLAAHEQLPISKVVRLVDMVDGVPVTFKAAIVVLERLEASEAHIDDDDLLESVHHPAYAGA